MTEEKILEIIKTTALMVNNSTKQENSGLVFSLKEIMEKGFDDTKIELLEIKEHVKETNGRVASLEGHKQYLWGSIATLLLVGGAILSLVLVGVQDRIKIEVDEAMHNKHYEI